MGALSSKLPYILFGFAFIAFAVILWSMFRGDDEDEYEDEEDDGLGTTKGLAHALDTMELPESEARKSRMLALKDSLDKSLQTRAAAGKAGGLDRLAMPWFMLVGTEGSGKKSLLASTGLPLPYGPPVEVDSIKKDSGRWWLFEQAVVVEAPTAKPVPKPAAPSAVTATEVHVDISDSWNNLLHLLRRERPDSPLNGIIVAISCADLVGTRRKSPEELAEQAELIRAFLEKTRQVLGVRLPLHLLITRCDVLPGFRSFAETLPEARRDDIFGWANPAPLERMFTPDAVDAGFVELRKSLDLLHDELLAAPERIADADGLFVFVNEFGEIQDPLKDFVTRLMPSGERRPSLFFRGVYFTGDASEFAARSAAKQDDDQATLHISIEATEAETHALVFLRSLFAKKIFEEAGLARSTARLKVSRDWRVVLAQAAAIVIALAGGFGLWASINGYKRGDHVYVRGLKGEVSSLTLALAGLAIDADELRRPIPPTATDSAHERLSRDGAVVSLVSETHGLAGAKLRTAFIPSSWFSPLPKEIDQTVVSSIQDVALPTIRARLVTRENHLVGVGPKEDALPDDLDPSDPESLKNYLKDVRDLSRNIARYNRIAKKDSGTVDDLAGLLDYLFASRPPDSLAKNAKFQSAIRGVTGAPVNVSASQVNRVVGRATRLIAIVADSAARALGSSSAAARPEDDLDGLGRIKSLIDLTDPKIGLVATVSDSTILGARLARSIQDSVGVYLGTTAVRVLRDLLPTDGARTRMVSVVSELYKLRLLEPGQGREISDELKPGQALRWDVGRLELAMALRGEQASAGVTVDEAFKPAAAARLKRAFALQMRSRTIDLVASAQRFTPDTVVSTETIRAETENLDAASSRLVRLSKVLADSLNARNEGRMLVVAGVRQAEQVLAMAQTILDTISAFVPHPAVVALWHGPKPVGQAALGVADSSEAYIKLNREGIPGVVALAGDVAPAVKYLKQPQVVAGMVEMPQLLNQWSAIGASVDKFNQTDFSSTLFAFRDYVTLTMGALDVRSCEAAAAKADTLKAAPDWFVQHRRQFRGTLIGRCGAMTTTVAALNAYDKIRDVFTAKLAGKFPFVDSAHAVQANDADPAAVRELYGLYDTFAKFDELVLRSDPRVGLGAKPAFTFLDQLARARPFFAPFIDSGAARRSPEYDFLLMPGKGSAAGGRLETGKRALAIDDSVHAGAWGFSEAVSAVGMAADSTPTKPLFKSSGWWGLVELASLQHDVNIRIYHPDTKVPLALPVFPQVAPVIPRR